MKKKITAILLTITLLAGCSPQAPVTPSAEPTPDIETIIRQSVDEAIREKAKEYEEEQKKKDQEIADLKKQVEELNAPPEALPESPKEDASAPPVSQPKPVPSQPEIPPHAEPPAQPTPEPVPPAEPTMARTTPLNEGTVFEGYAVKVTDWTTPAVISGGRDWPISTWYFFGPGETVLGSISSSALTAIIDRYHPAMNYDPEVDWSAWFADAFNEYRNLAAGGTQTEEWRESSAAEPPSDSTPSGGSFRLEDAEETIRLANLERESHGLESLPIDESLMELARVRAMELRGSYSHTRPDGTSVVDLRCGENGGRRSSAAEQVKSWMNSEGHRANILLERYHHIGAGCYQAENGNLYWILIFSLD